MIEFGKGSSVSVCTIVSGREKHLARVLQGLARSTLLPDEVIVVYMGDAPDTILGNNDLPFPLRVFTVDLVNGDLPLAAARNCAAKEARNDFLVYLDVDCIPSVDLIENHRRALGSSDQLWMGTVRYLQEKIHGAEINDLILYSLSEYNKLQPRLEEGERLPSEDYTLFWSLNFSVTSRTFDKIGGFDEQFIGYGGEDTDFSLAAKEANVKFGHVGALAFHQYHYSESPPLSHLKAIVRNSNYYRYKRGVFPMEKWLEAFANLQLIEIRDDHIFLTAENKF